ncbi:hypothetical protein [Longimicrobium sp.]|uniref:hypothetical protein n=1 Tax=Longimicrobium sp. TaxID=2029185 RepID=UPI002E349AE3|nr:hypothetical protein [Longimicrobium sp.]HEX6038766.1 hypothetical protein [Longimicrobium sp.]
MDTRPDIEVYSPDHRLQLVVEVKSTPGASPQWAARFRRNLLSHGAVPNAPYFLIALPDCLFLWSRSSGMNVPPDYEAATADVVREYLGSWAAGSGDLGEGSLQIAVGSWLRDLAQTFRRPRRDSEADRMLLDSGAYQAIRNGSVAFEPNGIGR